MYFAALREEYLPAVAQLELTLLFWNIFYTIVNKSWCDLNKFIGCIKNGSFSLCLFIWENCLPGMKKHE